MKNYLLLLLAGLLAAPAWAQYGCPEELFPVLDKKANLFGYKNLMGEWVIQPAFSGATLFDASTAIITQGNRYGVIDCKGHFVLPPKFDLIQEFNNGSGWVKLNGLWALYSDKNLALQTPQFLQVRQPVQREPFYYVQNEAGNWGVFLKDANRFIITPSLEAISPLTDSAALGRVNSLYRIINYKNGATMADSLAWVVPEPGGAVAYVKNQKWGLLAPNGKPIAKPEWDSTYSTPGRLAIVRKGNKYGAISPSGKTVLPTQFDEIMDFVQGYLPARKGNNWGYYDGTGRPIGPQNLELALPLQSTGIGLVIAPSGYGLYRPSKQTYVLPPNWPYIQEWGNRYLLYPRLDSIDLRDQFLRPVKTPFTLQWVAVEDPLSATRVKIKGKMTIIDGQTLNLRKMQPFDSLSPLHPHGHYWAFEGNKVGVLSSSGSVIIPPTYDSVQHLPTQQADKYYFRVWRKGQAGLALQSGKEVIAPSYQAIHVAQAGFFKVKENGLWGVLAPGGKVAVPPTYSSISLADEQPGTQDFPAVVGQKGQYGAIDKAGKVLIPIKYSQLKPIGSNLYAFEQKGMWGLLKADGTTILKPTYAEIGLFADGLAPVNKDGKWGYVNAIGKLSIPTQYEQALPFSRRTALVKQGGLWGTINQAGKWEVQPRFPKVQAGNDGTYRAGF